MLLARFGNLTKLKILHRFECEVLEFPLGLSDLLVVEELNCTRCQVFN